MKKKNLVSFIVAVIAIVFISQYLIPIGSDNTYDDFFYWIDGYVAFEENSQTSFALTYYYNKNKSYTNFNKINRMEFMNADNVSIANYTIADMKFGKNAKYSAYSITINLLSNSIGTDSVHYLKIYTDTINYKIYPIGSWFFDIGPKESNPDLLDTWSSPVITDNSSEFPYSYKVISKNIKIRELWYGENQFLESADGLKYENKVNITSSTAPVKYIKSKIIVEKNNQIYTVYGKGCYSGAMSTSDESIELSKQYYFNNQYQKK